MRYTMRELVTNHIAADDDVFTRLLVYPFALPTTWFILNYTHIGANAVTLAGLTIGVAGCVAAVLKQQLWLLCLAFCLYFICDFVDGQVASVRGGSQLGALLDHGTDHLMILLGTLCLGTHHMIHGLTRELFMLLLYIGLHTYIDLLLFAKHRATRQQHFGSGATNLPKSKPRVRGATFSLWRLLPSRLSSPLAMMIAYACSGAFVVAYAFALLWVGVEYAAGAVKFGLRLAQERQRQPFLGQT